MKTAYVMNLVFLLHFTLAANVKVHFQYREVKLFFSYFPFSFPICVITIDAE